MDLNLHNGAGSMQVSDAVFGDAGPSARAAAPSDAAIASRMVGIRVRRVMENCVLRRGSPRRGPSRHTLAKRLG